jgi:hypothetical protein
VIANAGQAAGVLPIPNQLGPEPARLLEGHAHMPAAQPNRERLLVHEASAPREPGADACCPRYTRSHGRLAHTDNGKGPPVVLRHGPDMPPRLLVALHLAAERRTHSRDRLRGHA